MKQQSDLLYLAVVEETGEIIKCSRDKSTVNQYISSCYRLGQRGEIRNETITLQAIPCQDMQEVQGRESPETQRRILKREILKGLRKMFLMTDTGLNLNEHQYMYSMSAGEFTNIIVNSTNKGTFINISISRHEEDNPEPARAKVYAITGLIHGMLLKCDYKGKVNTVVEAPVFFSAYSQQKDPPENIRIIRSYNDGKLVNESIGWLNRDYNNNKNT